jgi:hypothetical protein
MLFVWYNTLTGPSSDRRPKGWCVGRRLAVLCFSLPESNGRILPNATNALQELFRLVWARLVMRSTLLAALRFEEEDLLPHCQLVSPNSFHHVCRISMPVEQIVVEIRFSYVREQKV